MSKVLIANRFHPHILLKAQQMDGLDVHSFSQIEEGREHWEDTEALIIRSGTHVTEQLLKHFPKLKVIVTATSGFDHIDLSKTQKIQVYHVPEAHVLSVMELTTFFLFASARKTTQARRQLEKGSWQRSSLMGNLVTGKTMGLVGLGRIGKAVAERALALGLKVQAFDPYIQEHPKSIEMLGYEEVMRSSDIVSFHVPLTKKTRAMVKAETLSWMSDSAVLINTSRGEVINENDLILHLKENPNFRAALDVFEHEPLKRDSPLLELPNVVLSPHIGATTEEALLSSSSQALEKVVLALKGESVKDELPPREFWWSDNA